jgi:hypothetical protein
MFYFELLSVHKAEQTTAVCEKQLLQNKYTHNVKRANDV